MAQLLIDVLKHIISFCDTRTKLIFTETSKNINILVSPSVVRNLINFHLDDNFINYNERYQNYGYVRDVRINGVPFIGMCKAYTFSTKMDRFYCGGYKMYKLTRSFIYKKREVRFVGVIKRFGLGTNFHRLYSMDTNGCFVGKLELMSRKRGGDVLTTTNYRGICNKNNIFNIVNLNSNTVRHFTNSYINEMIASDFIAKFRLY